MVNKKGDLYENWVEILGFSFLIIGALLSVFMPSAVINYVVVFIAGMMAGRMLYYRKYKFKMSVILIIIMFLFGYILFSPYGNSAATFLFFMLGSVVSYRLHHDGYVK